MIRLGDGHIAQKEYPLTFDATKQKLLEDRLTKASPSAPPLWLESPNTQVQAVSDTVLDGSEEDNGGGGVVDPMPPPSFFPRKLVEASMALPPPASRPQPIIAAAPSTAPDKKAKGGSSLVRRASYPGESSNKAQGSQSSATQGGRGAGRKRQREEDASHHGHGHDTKKPGLTMAVSSAAAGGGGADQPQVSPRGEGGVDGGAQANAGGGAAKGATILDYFTAATKSAQTGSSSGASTKKVAATPDTRQHHLSTLGSSAAAVIDLASPSPNYTNKGILGSHSSTPSETSTSLLGAAQTPAHQQPASNVHSSASKSVEAENRSLQELNVSLLQELDKARVEIDKWKGKAEKSKDDLDKLKLEYDRLKADAAGLQEDLRKETLELRQTSMEKEQRLKEALEKNVRNLCRREAQALRQEIASFSTQLGKLVTAPAPLGNMTGHKFQFGEVWEDGPLLRDVKTKQVDIIRRREEVEKRKRQVAKDIKKVEKGRGMTDGDASAGEEGSVNGIGTIALSFDEEAELLDADEIVKLRLSTIKRDETLLAEERRRLEAMKLQRIRLTRLTNLEDQSRFCNLPLLSGRYLLMSMVGKGGFSEVWKALNLETVKEVAVKIHQLANNWSEEKRAHYTRHAHREYEIHKDMAHPHIVKLQDVFEIDAMSFATVQELCGAGGPGQTQDLEQHIKAHAPLPEREAKSILCQLLGGLKYLHFPPAQDKRPAIIHYDLKPANCLFDEHGDVKITDFGLSKIVEQEQEAGGVELTSQGAGTIWYLPPECFRVGGASAPRISGKVDVWSVGVIFYQMLYGKRPFGEGQQPQQLLAEKTMLHSILTSFPPKPVVSAEAKAFISACLTPSQDDRPDVKGLYAHPYIQMRFKEKKSASHS